MANKTTDKGLITNIQAVQAAQYQKKISSQKVGRRSKETFLQRQADG